jgi:two-component sensor histidine kinase
MSDTEKINAKLDEMAEAHQQTSFRAARANIDIANLIAALRIAINLYYDLTKEAMRFLPEHERNERFNDAIAAALEGMYERLEREEGKP